MIVNPALHLFADRVCPYCQRVEIFARGAGIVLQRTEVELTKVPRELAQQTPNGKVPILVRGDGRVLWESLAIIEFLETQSSRRAERTSWERARARAWCLTLDGYQAALRRVLAATSRREATLAWWSLATRLRAGAPALTAVAWEGQALSVAGSFLAPLLILLDAIAGLDVDTEVPPLAALHRRVLAAPPVAACADARYRARLREFLGEARPWLLEPGGLHGTGAPESSGDYLSRC